ncbi:hypothetical protein CC1G_12835 [Coprinopsis cinerea okayama7|uniref:CxC2-like cysteine cluster KDZ transposase-associated domain-containing protein n=1 Tax=Coprinopsis cinerea (strain Okayama-7 / 130 / ATCC MYA-4618 / FGSC 9003) TaxID=240176 RepID=A8NJJ2_COPC7|nr:hypothetical protein CC1G_12835 [Coprinopsis cinerea okayama7\|eukprot:XP_001834238.2 hypothetical protein CC1G_12835 [Coprinopsis cinerea okayama7\
MDVIVPLTGLLLTALPGASSNSLSEVSMCEERLVSLSNSNSPSTSSYSSWDPRCVRRNPEGSQNLSTVTHGDSIECFASAHRLQPLHWAHVWNNTHQYFERKDLSEIHPTSPFTIGHNRDNNPCAAQSGKVTMTLVDVNGVHTTRVSFCDCQGVHDRVTQLMKSGFFPATLSLPRTAFTFAVLRHFQLLQLEAKASAYDFCTALRRLSDFAFTKRIPDIYPQFVVVMQIWRVLMAIQDSGQAHGINKILHNRQPGNLIVHCPVCPVLTDGNGSNTPHALRHLQLTADGNHHANWYLKSTDPLSRSLFNGRAYFPRGDEYKTYLRRVNNSEAEPVLAELIGRKPNQL